MMRALAALSVLLQASPPLRLTWVSCHRVGKLEGRRAAESGAVAAAASSGSNVLSLTLADCDFHTDVGAVTGDSLQHAVTIMDMSGGRYRPSDIVRVVHNARLIPALTAVDLSGSSLSDVDAKAVGTSVLMLTVAVVLIRTACVGCHAFHSLLALRMRAPPWRRGPFTHLAAASATLRAIGPITASSPTCSTSGAVPTLPRVGLMPTSPVTLAGIRIDPPPSEP